MPEASGILSGTHVLELGSGAAGPLATRSLAEHGADVIRIESARRPDFLRLMSADPTAPGALDRSALFVLLNPDKRSVALDLSQPEGIALAKRLVAWADVVCENFAPGVMQRLGLGWETLRTVKPDLIMLSSSLFGQSGPQRTYPGFGGQGSAIAGFNHLTGTPDGEAHGPYGTITDTLSPRFAALLIVAALLERLRTGEGQYLDLSQIEVGVYTLSEMIVRRSAREIETERRGNRSEHAAPHNAYPAAGDDTWVVLAIHSDDEWLTLRELMGSPEWAMDPRYVELAGRQADEDAIDAAIAAWSRDQEPHALMMRLQQAGLEGGIVQDPADLPGDPQLLHRGHFQNLTHPHLGELPFERAGFRLSEHAGRLAQPAPDLGEHTHEVLREVLGLSPEEIAHLAQEGVLA